MSYAQSKPREMHCKVCESAKKPQSVIASHFPKKNGVTVCPTLLSQQCRGCGNNGHTIRYCFPVQVKQQMQEKQQQAQAQVKPKRTITSVSIDVLYVSSDEELDEPKTKKEEPKAKKEPNAKKAKKEKTEEGTAKKFCWANADSDSSGSEDSDSD